MPVGYVLLIFSVFSSKRDSILDWLVLRLISLALVNVIVPNVQRVTS